MLKVSAQNIENYGYPEKNNSEKAHTDLRFS
jgi:hypothetical protein